MGSGGRCGPLVVGPRAGLERKLGWGGLSGSATQSLSPSLLSISGPFAVAVKGAGLCGLRGRSPSQHSGCALLLPLSALGAEERRG